MDTRQVVELDNRILGKMLGQIVCQFFNRGLLPRRIPDEGES
jgi:hypothetical protein